MVDYKPLSERPLLGQKTEQENVEQGAVVSYYLAVLSRSGKTNAENLLQELSGLGFTARVVSEQLGTTIYYAVQIGPFPSEESAQAKRETLPRKLKLRAKTVRR